MRPSEPSQQRPQHFLLTVKRILLFTGLVLLLAAFFLLGPVILPQTTSLATASHVPSNDPSPVTAPASMLESSKSVATPDISSVSAVISNYYIDSVYGSDSNGGTSENSAWKTLAPVNNHQFHPGDTVNFRANSTWSGGLKITSSGEPGNPITFRSYGTGTKPTFRRPGFPLGHGIEIRASWIVVDGLLAQNAAEAGIYIASGSNHNIVQNSEVTQSGTGVTIYGQNNLITKSYFHDLTSIRKTLGGYDDYGAVGIWVWAPGNEISYNKFLRCKYYSYDFGLDGGVVELYETADNTNIHHNWAQNNGGFIEVGSDSRRGSAKNVVVAYNVSINNGNPGGVFIFHLGGRYNSFISNFRVENNTFVEDANIPMRWKIINFTDKSPLPTTLYLRNNIFYLNNYYRVAYNRTFSHDHNIYYFLNKQTVVGYSLGQGEHRANPLFVNITARDLHLRGTSPAIGAGVNLGYGLDFDSQPVPTTKPPEIGAYQFVNP